MTAKTSPKNNTVTATTLKAEFASNLATSDKAAIDAFIARDHPTAYLALMGRAVAKAAKLAKKPVADMLTQDGIAKAVKSGIGAMGLHNNFASEVAAAIDKNTPKRVRVFAYAAGDVDGMQEVIKLSVAALETLSQGIAKIERANADTLAKDPKAETTPIAIGAVLDDARKAARASIKDAIKKNEGVIAQGAYRTAKSLLGDAAVKDVTVAAPKAKAKAPNPAPVGQTEDDDMPPEADAMPEASTTTEGAVVTRDDGEAKTDWEASRDLAATLLFDLLRALEGPITGTKGGIAAKLAAGPKRDSIMKRLNDTRAALEYATE